jgi:hypothetical protein
MLGDPSAAGVPVTVLPQKTLSAVDCSLWIAAPRRAPSAPS